MLKKVFIERAHCSHKADSIDYSSLPERLSVNQYLTFVCPVHGEFKQKGYQHLEGGGCPKCSRFKRHHLDRNVYLQRFYDFHGKETYCYDLLPDKLRNSTIIAIICKKHGIFTQSVYTHCHHGCPKCYHEKSKHDQQTTKEEVIRKSKSLGFNLGYDLLPDRMNAKEYVTFICPVHGEYKQKLLNHLYLKQGCKKCANERLGNLRSIGGSTFLKRLQGIHEEGHYSYASIPYNLRTSDKIKIHCNIHNHDFKQTAKMHLYRHGCPICGKGLSKRENELTSFINSLGFDVIQRYSIAETSRHEIDIYIPSLKIGFEYNGIYWHSSDKSSLSQKDEYYHQNKQLLALSKGIDLFYIWEDTTKESQEEIIKDILHGSYSASVKDGLVDKDLCPSYKYLPKGYAVECELPPCSNCREYRKQLFLTYNSGMLKVIKVPI